LSGYKPRVLLLADRPEWAFARTAQAISRRLSDEFDFQIEYTWNQPDLSRYSFDLFYVFFFGATYHQRFVDDPRRVIKEISSHRWESGKWGSYTPAEAAEKYLRDAGTLLTPSRRLQALFAPYRAVRHVPKGFEPDEFRVQGTRSGGLRIGWAGNLDDPCKGIKEILLPAAGSDLEIHIAGGDCDYHRMAEFYNSIDVLCVASTAEGMPLTLVEGLACGCFPVCVDVGIVPELVRHGDNGLVVNGSPAAFRAAFQWCASNLDRVRQAGLANAEEMLRTRSWDVTCVHWREVLREAWNVLQPDGHPADSGA
jgi:glycosyltransferase involved in cell wall biosynthesis